MTGSTHAPLRAKVVALSLATGLLVGGLATTTVAAATTRSGDRHAATHSQSLGKWPRITTYGKKW